MEEKKNSELTVKGFLLAAECNAQQEMSLPMLVTKMTDIATEHAHQLGVGYERLLQDNNAWVLSRLSLELKRLPHINESYSLTTWVESINRHFSERIVMLSDAAGEPIAYGRLIWVAINIATRRPADLTPLLANITPSERRCPSAPVSKLPSIADPDSITTYQFRFSDIDFNRHVNSARYVEIILNRWSLHFFDTNRISRFEIAYQTEAHFDDIVDIRCKHDGDANDVELVNNGVVCTRARVRFTAR